MKQLSNFFLFVLVGTVVESFTLSRCNDAECTSSCGLHTSFVKTVYGSSLRWCSHKLQNNLKDHTTDGCHYLVDDDTNQRRTFLRNMLLFMSVVFNQPAVGNAQGSAMLPLEGEIENAFPLDSDWMDSDNPFSSLSSSDFNRLDTKPDSIFYAEPRIVEHVDSNAVQIMTDYIENSALNKNDSVLDLCTSWTSHISPATVQTLQLERVSGLGMNADEMSQNSILNDFVVMDLNNSTATQKIKLPYPDKSFNVVLCQLSIDYLIRPFEVMEDVWRVLKPGGKIVILFSNRLFLEKAVGIWTGKDDIDHAYTVGGYLRFCESNFINIRAKDLSTRRKKGKESVIVGDPMYVVTAMRAND